MAGGEGFWLTAPAGGSVPSGTLSRLGRTSYNPGSLTTYSITSNTYVDLDATNLTVTLTAPASGTVWVRVEVSALIPGGGNTYLNINVRSGGSDVPGTGARMLGSGAMQGRCVYTARVTGLTAGASYTYAIGVAELGTGTASVYAGGDIGPAIIEVFAEAA